VARLPLSEGGWEERIKEKDEEGKSSTQRRGTVVRVSLSEFSEKKGGFGWTKDRAGRLTIGIVENVADVCGV